MGLSVVIMIIKDLVVLMLGFFCVDVIDRRHNMFKSFSRCCFWGQAFCGHLRIYIVHVGVFRASKGVAVVLLVYDSCQIVGVILRARGAAAGRWRILPYIGGKICRFGLLQFFSGFSLASWVRIVRADFAVVCKNTSGLMCFLKPVFQYCKKYDPLRSSLSEANHRRFIFLQQQPVRVLVKSSVAATLKSVISRSSCIICFFLAIDSQKFTL